MIAAAKPGVVVTVNTKTANNGSVSDDVPPQAPGARRQAWARRKAGKPHNRRRRPGQHNTAVSGSDSSHGSSLVHRRISAASGGSVVVREALAMVDTCNNWMACLTQGTVDFSLPAGPASLFGTCIVSPQRQVMSLSGFDAYVQQPRAMAATTHINDVFQKNFAALVLSLVNSCFERKIASAIRLVHRRLPYNVVAYPLTVPPDIVEGVLLVYREDQVAPAEFSNLIVTPCKMSNSVSF